MQHTRGRSIALPHTLAIVAGSLLAAPLGAVPSQQDQPVAGTPITLIRTDLSAHPGFLLSWGDAGIRFANAAGVEQTLAADAIAGLAPESWTPAPGAAASADDLAPRRGWAGILELTDGQRLVGRPITDADAAGIDHIAWNHPRLGPLMVSLDRVARVRTGLGSGEPPAVDAGADDLVILVNGDFVRGLVEQIAATVIITTGPIAAEGAAGGKVEVPLDRVRDIVLTNPAAAPEGSVLWFDEGTVVAVEGIEPRARSNAPSLAVRPQRDLGSREGVWRLDELEAVLFDAARHRGLASFPIARHDHAPGSDRRRVEPPRILRERGVAAPLWAADIELPGPMLTEWTLPQGASRLAGWAELPAENWAWGDCELVISAGTRELFRTRLSAAAPLARFDISLNSPSLRITVEPGEHGPIQDRVILRRTLIALDE